MKPLVIRDAQLKSVSLNPDGSVDVELVAPELGGQATIRTPNAFGPVALLSPRGLPAARNADGRLMTYRTAPDGPHLHAGCGGEVQGVALDAVCRLCGARDEPRPVTDPAGAVDESKR